MAVHPVARRAALGFLSASLAGALLLAASCGGLVEQDLGNVSPGKPDAQAGGAGGGAPDAGDAGKDAKPPKDAGKDADAKEDAKDALPDYVDPGCPDAGPPITSYECDPYDDNCGEGKGCYPFVQYPTEPCAQEVYGATCIFVGNGGQGDPCGGGCKASHICVISGQGTQCVQMCDLGEPNPCKDGLVCAAVDIPGIGGCL
jgi:hypothetical protein